MVESLYVRTGPQVSLYFISCSKPEDAADQIGKFEVRFHAQIFFDSVMIISLHFGQSQSCSVSHTIVALLLGMRTPALFKALKECIGQAGRTVAKPVMRLTWVTKRLVSHRPKAMYDLESPSKSIQPLHHNEIM